MMILPCCICFCSNCGSGLPDMMICGETPLGKPATRPAGWAALAPGGVDDLTTC